MAFYSGQFYFFIAQNDWIFGEPQASGKSAPAGA